MSGLKMSQGEQSGQPVPMTSISRIPLNVMTWSLQSLRHLLVSHPETLPRGRNFLVTFPSHRKTCCQRTLSSWNMEQKTINDQLQSHHRGTHAWNYDRTLWGHIRWVTYAAGVAHVSRRRSGNSACIKKHHTGTGQHVEGIWPTAELRGNQLQHNAMVFFCSKASIALAGSLCKYLLAVLITAFFLDGAICLSAGHQTWGLLADQRGIEPPPAVCPRHKSAAIPTGPRGHLAVLITASEADAVAGFMDSWCQAVWCHSTGKPAEKT